MDNSRQSILPEFDPRLDKTTGWKGVEPVTALRVQGRHPAGEPVPQEYANINFELGDSWNPDSEDKHPPDDDPIWIPHLAHTSHWADRNKKRNRRHQIHYSKDPISGARYGKKMLWPSLHHKRKKFLDMADAKQGTWVARPTKGDAHNLYTHNNPEKMVFIRGPIDQYGKVHRRDSDEAGEGVAEAFIEHDENIPPEQLVSIPLGEKSYHSVAEDMGVPDMGFNARMGGKGTTSRWSDELPPFSKKTGEPMEIAFQLLKERKSPEAWANKKRYDSEYQKTPKRVKYREQLNAERRKRGIYGKGGKDVSHTQGGKLTLESAHANRARHFKNRGTLRRVKVR